MGALILAGVLVLTGCSASRGANAVETGERLLTYPGIADTSVLVSGSKSGFTVSTSASITVSLAAGYTVADADAFVGWALRTGWSVNNTKLNSGVMVTVLDANATPLSWDLCAAALETFGVAASSEPAIARANYEATGTVSVRADELETILGPWPGDIPTFPADALTRK
ncbi:hypothetical protein E3O44_14205 [Cryobacterium algoricola]|uniref:Uncharacterized protein n=1 Tax=Cryobacterium algoricola TaxID=1259183 RepID=A0ABY2I9V2_9MICO|nr:hypothetical protein [Cryobacterium algoricola]TFB85329.1 hypothetical protein E3O44_14205 [Cryobacterium algoricola]